MGKHDESHVGGHIICYCFQDMGLYVVVRLLCICPPFRILEPRWHASSLVVFDLSEMIC